MEITYINGNVLVIHSEQIEMVGFFHKWKISHRRKSYLIRLTINTSLLFPKKNFHFFHWNEVVVLLLTSPNNKNKSENAYNTTATLDKLACTDYVDFGHCQERSGRISWLKKDSNYMDIKLKVFKREDKTAELRLRQNLSMGGADFNQFIRQRNQLVVAADNFLREQNLSTVPSVYTVQRHGGAIEACSQGD